MAAEELAERPRVGRHMSDVSDAVLLPSPSPSRRRRYSLVNLRDRVQRLYLGLPLVSGTTVTENMFQETAETIVGFVSKIYS